MRDFAPVTRAWDRSSRSAGLRWTRRDPEVDRAYRLAQHAAVLTRLAGRIDVLLTRGGRDGQHLRAASTAYDQTLLIVAGEMGLDSDLQAPLRPVDRLALEAELALAGLRWTHVGGERSSAREDH